LSINGTLLVDNEPLNGQSYEYYILYMSNGEEEWYELRFGNEVRKIPAKEPLTSEHIHLKVLTSTDFLENTYSILESEVLILLQSEGHLWLASIDWSTYEDS
jgi:hypothetical protein